MIASYNLRFTIFLLYKIHGYTSTTFMVISFITMVVALIFKCVLDFEAIPVSFPKNFFVLMEGNDSGTETSGEGAGSSKQPSSSPGGPDNKDSRNPDAVKNSEKQERDDENKKFFESSKLTGGRADNGEMHVGVFDPKEEMLPCWCCETKPCRCGGPQPESAPVEKWEEGIRPYCFDGERSAGANNIDYTCCCCGELGYAYECSDCGCVYCRGCHSNHG